MVEQNSGPQTSEIARRVLEELFRWWPAPRDVDPSSFGLEGDEGKRLLLTVMEGLRDRGYVMYEAVVTRSGMPCFRDALITPGGRAALRASQSDQA